ncbi:MAG: hypothetical protein Q8Q62_09780 [Mesorhizobium sp.]|nr:hypothetical protein [Mesorhizobium sp.]
MHGKAKTGVDMLERIVALLLALADLADRCAERSAFVRRLVLACLWQAVDVAGGFAAGRASNAPARQPDAMNVQRGHAPADAMRLAASLRALALMLRNLAARMRRSVAMPFLARDRVAMPRPFTVTAVEFRDTS